MKRTLQVVSMGLLGAALAATLAFAQATPATPASPAKTTTTTTKTSTRMSKEKAVSAMPTIDINSASKEDLMKLPGVGDAIAEKIIAGRPYTSKVQLESKGIVNKATYAKIRSHVVAKQSK